MLLRTVSALEGLRWVKQGFIWLARQPLQALLLVMVYLFLVGGLSMLPVLGGLVPLLAAQLLAPGFMQASRLLQARENLNPGVLLTGLRAAPPRRRALLVVAVAYTGAVVAVLAIAGMIDGGALLRLALFDAMPDPKLVQQGSLRAASLLAGVCYIPVSMALWFAPPLVIWWGMGPWQALFTSFVVVLRNLRAFVVYLLQWTLMFAALPVLAVQLAMLAGLQTNSALLAAAPVVLILFLGFVLSFQATVQSLFGDPPV